MADVRPFRSLRYDIEVAGDPATLIAPPYDVVSAADREEIYRRGPFNAALVDYGEEFPEDDAVNNRYIRAAMDLKAWRQLDVLKRESAPRIYVYDQEFRLGEETKRRRAVFTRLRLEDWENGIVLPHEVTGAAAKEDRLRLLQSTRVNLSPIMALYRAGAASLSAEAVGFPIFDVALGNARHTLLPVDRGAAEVFCKALANEKLYIADGHHRYETALAYRNERRDAAASWTGDEPENFVLAALIDAADAGLVVLPTHRLLKLPNRTPDLSSRLTPLFEVEELGPLSDAALAGLMSRLAAAKGAPAFGAIGLQAGKLHLITPRDLDAAVAKTPAEHSAAWRRLDVTILQHAVLPALGFDEQPDRIDYTEDARQAAEAVASERWDVALLLNPTPADQVIAVADAGDRMPRKSTYFYPKLATGMVFYPFE